MKGVSLLEIIVTVAIVAVLSLMSINTINNFKTDASLDNTVNEFISEVRLARNKSMNGELLPSETEDDFDKDGLPEYGIMITSDSYKLIRKCLKADSSSCSGDSALETISLGTDYNLSPEGSLYFDRISGNSSGFEISIVDKSGKNGRKVNINNDFTITVSKI